MERKKFIVACNGVKLNPSPDNAKYVELLHNHDLTSTNNVKIELQNFVTNIFTLSDRKKDLMEIAGYIFAADRKCSRGNDKEIIYDNWSRDIEIHIKVRDLHFWQDTQVIKALNEALTFMTGDFNFNFVFYKYEDDHKYNLFDNDNFVVEPTAKTKVVLFSGGLDSLAGIIELLETTENQLWLVSHQSGNPSVAQTQKNLFEEIKSLYPNRSYHYKYKCGLTGQQRADENQRTRSFLFNSIAFVLSTTYGHNENLLFENGITSFNFPESEDMQNSRASRTTHPKTLALLMNLFSLIEGKPYKIYNGFVFKSKTDVMEILKNFNKLNLLSIAVSCSATRINIGSRTHCGICSQCIDRRFASYSAEVENFDETGLYHFDFVTQVLDSDDKKKALSNYINLTKIFYKSNLDSFNFDFSPQIIDIENYLSGNTDSERILKIFELCQRHGKQVEKALGRMSEKHDKAFSDYKENSLFDLILGMRGASAPKSNSQQPQIDENTTRELGNAQEIIKKQKLKIKTLSNPLTHSELFALSEKTKKKNGSINYSAIAKNLGISNHTAKQWCRLYKIS